MAGEISMDVNVGVDVPLNILALVDRDTSKVVQSAVAAASLTLRWNFVTTAGAVTSTTVIAITAPGEYGLGGGTGGMYTIQSIPASGGGSINNDATGYGWFSGEGTSVLPFRGPVIEFRAAPLNAALVDGGDNLDVNVTEISGSSAAADNVQSILTGTGIADDVDIQFRSLAVTNDTGSAITATASGGDGSGLDTVGNGSGSGLRAIAGETGSGIGAAGGATSGAGIEAVAQNNNDAGMLLTKHGTGADLSADIVGDITGNLSGSVGSVGAGGITAASFAANALVAATFAASSLDGKGDWNTVTPDAAGVAATAAKLLAYVQLLARKDEAIETDNATELTAINADEGSGAGSYLNDQHGLEAIRYRGDQAWLTGAGAGATETYTENTNWTRTTGDNDGGAASDTLSVNGTVFATGETAAGVYLQVDVVFTITSGEVGNTIDIWGAYDGGGQHYIQVLALDTVSSAYEPLGSISNHTTINKHSFSLSPGHTNGTAVTIRFLHQGGTGNASHVFNVDKAQVNTITPATEAPSVAAIADGVWDETSGSHTGGGKAGDQLWTDVDAILVDTAEIGTAGAGLTNINLPNQTMNIVGDITGNLSGSVGSVGTGGITAASFAADALVAATFATGALTADAFAANALVAATFAASSLDGKGDWNTVVPDAAGVAPTAVENADAILNRAASNIEDTADKHSLGAVIMIATNSSVSETTLTAKKPSDDTTFDTYTITTDADADPTTGIS